MYHCMCTLQWFHFCRTVQKWKEVLQHLTNQLGRTLFCCLSFLRLQIYHKLSTFQSSAKVLHLFTAAAKIRCWKNWKQLRCCNIDFFHYKTASHFCSWKSKVVTAECILAEQLMTSNCSCWLSWMVSATTFDTEQSQSGAVSLKRLLLSIPGILYLAILYCYHCCCSVPQGKSLASTALTIIYPT